LLLDGRTQIASTVRVNHKLRSRIDFENNIMTISKTKLFVAFSFVEHDRAEPAVRPLQESTASGRDQRALRKEMPLEHRVIMDQRMGDLWEVNEGRTIFA